MEGGVINGLEENDNSHFHHEEDDVGETTASNLPPVQIHDVSWMTQMRYATTKNMILLSRSPIMMFMMLSCNCISVLLAWWLAGHDISPTSLPPLNNCGTVDRAYVINASKQNENFLQDIYYGSSYGQPPSTLNDKWFQGTPVAFLSFGPFLFACCVFMIVHEELYLHLFEVLRGLSLRDSVYWMSWYVSFALVSIMSSLIGSITSRIVPVHAMQATSFGCVFISFFCLHLALNSASIFLAALLGTRKRGTTYVIMIMFVALWAPRIFITNQSFWTETSSFTLSEASTATADFSSSPLSLFWIYSDTNVIDLNYTGSNVTFETCNIPIMSEEQGQLPKTDAERIEVKDDEFFLGCYVNAGIVSTAWYHPSTKSTLSRMILFMIPYFQFTMIWGNFLGMTSLPGNKFNSKHMAMSSGQLAFHSLPSNFDESNTTYYGTLMPAGSTINKQVYYDESFWLGTSFKSNCPDQNRSGYDFCEFNSNCPYAVNSEPQNGKSVNQLLWQLIAQAIFYMLFAAYFGAKFIGGGSQVHSWLFPFQKKYWFGPKKENDAVMMNGSSYSTIFTDGVLVDNVRKSYGTVEAVKGVTIKMTRGEVTALLGHNGAGKTTLSHILCCEHRASLGDVSVFGHSVTNDPLSVRKLVGVCKQDDYLWPRLSAKEHLELYAGLRGVTSADAPHIVQKWLESVDLDSVMDQPAASFSGGMKRRLSLCLATVGDSQKLIILDEPTTGMDPVSRRFVWKHLDEVKHDRVVLLTTHAMEEADLLADMVGIMKEGELVAFGSPLELKAQYGTALQFTVLVEKSETQNTVSQIRDHFMTATEWIDLKFSEAGNISVTIKKVQEQGSGDGIDVSLLINFVRWLESDESRVKEYGFSNSSLEEVFLKVTHDELPQTEGNDTVAESENEADLEIQPTQTAQITSYQPKLALIPQVLALFRHFIRLTWLGKRSLWTWVSHLVQIVIVLWYGFQFSQSYYDGAGPAMFILPIVFLSTVLVNVTSIVYWDRNEGLIYYMRSQGLLLSSYLTGIGLYSLFVYFCYGFVLLSFFFSTSMFREPTLCSGDNCHRQKTDPPFFYYDSLKQVQYETPNNVTLLAYLVPSGYKKMFGAIFFFAITGPGAVLSSSFIPGHKFALLLIALSVLVASLAPLFILLSFFVHEQKVESCIKRIDPKSICDGISTSDTNSVDLLNCVGIAIANMNSLCIPSYAALLPQIGLFQLLFLLMSTDIKFVSEPKDYASSVFIPSLNGVSCTSDTCEFPYANQLYRKNAGFMVVSALCLLALGAYTARMHRILSAKISHALDIFSHILSSRRFDKYTTSAHEEEMELHEVIEERKIVDELIIPYIAKPADAADGHDDSHFVHLESPRIEDHLSLPRDDLPPILTHKLRKEYPTFGGLPPKVALKSLDIHVPRGQVLGLLGKNGAGKTTALKILSMAHEGTSGVALVAGYDVSCEKLSVFGRLGNCAQFDVIWPTLSVRDHLVFFSQLKGLSRHESFQAAHEMANAVGLGAHDVFCREAGHLSGGMRRRLSIACALLGSPDVFLLDEPTTGLDPSTRNSIWSLVTSFATENRSIIITTHMMVEADTLCNRIAIVSKGQLKVIASQQHLKDTYGSGYLLQLNLTKSTPENQQIVTEFVHTHLHQNATLQTKQAKTLHFSLPRDIELEHVFEALYSHEKRPDSINQFLLSQSSLEEVFIALGD